MRRKNGVPLDTVMHELQRFYKPPKTFLHFRTPLDLLVATVLSAQCTDVRVNLVTKTILYPKYKTAEDYVAVPRAELERDIHSCGTFRMKAKHIQEICALLIDHHGSKIPKTMEELIALPGIGRKTANVILSAAYSINVGIAVDTHVIRVAQRLGLTDSPDPKKIELDLIAQECDRKKWRSVTTLLISHGRAVCTARDRRCGTCVFKDRCPSSLTRGKGDLAGKSKYPRSRGS